MNDLTNIANRSNINSYSFRGKRIFIYNDHRTILNIIFFALKNRLISEIPNVFYFDYHDDAKRPKESLLKKGKDYSLNKTTIEEFTTIVEFELSPLDDDWVKAGMEFGLIKNSVSIGTEKYNTLHEVYKDSKNQNHDIICISHLSEALSTRGSLGDSVIKENYYKRARELFNYNNKNLNHFSENTKPFVLDFDLDCFSGQFINRQMAWTEKMFQEELNSRCGYYDDITPLSFINELIARCEFITISMEPDYCGGLGESFKILSYLDKYIFKGILQTSTCA